MDRFNLDPMDEVNDIQKTSTAGLCDMYASFSNTEIILKYQSSELQ